MSAHSCTRYNRCDLSPEEVQAVRAEQIEAAVEALYAAGWFDQPDVDPDHVRGIVYALCAADRLF